MINNKFPELVTWFECGKDMMRGTDLMRAGRVKLSALQSNRPGIWVLNSARYGLLTLNRECSASKYSFPHVWTNSMTQRAELMGALHVIMCIPSSARSKCSISLGWIGSCSGPAVGELSWLPWAAVLPMTLLMQNLRKEVLAEDMQTIDLYSEDFKNQGTA